FAEEARKDPRGIEKALGELKSIASNPKKYVTVVSSVGAPGDSTYLDPGSKIVPFHDYVVKEIADSNQTICILDPYGSRILLVLDYDDFFQYFNGITKATVER